MRQEDIHMTSASAFQRDVSRCMMREEIKDTEVWFHALSEGNKKIFPPISHGVRILFLCFGTVNAVSGDDSKTLTDRTVYIGRIHEPLELCARTDCNLIELIRNVTPEEMTETDDSQLPYALSYYDAQKYTEECKSPKTVSRMLVPARIVPRFAMGSVETGGDDLVEAHTHPMLEQYFFGLSDNDCSLLVDDVKAPFGGNVLVHIPLGSNHGILSEGNQKVNYLWMDFLFDEESLAYMDSEHHMIEE